MLDPQIENSINKAIIDELVIFQGQTFSNSYDVHKWLEKAFYRIADKAREEGRQEEIMRMQPDTIVSNIQIEERTRILNIIEGMKENDENKMVLSEELKLMKKIWGAAQTSNDLTNTRNGWNQALNALKEKLQ